MKKILNKLASVFGTEEKVDKLKEAYGGMTKFERTLLNKWLMNMGVTPSKLSLEQKVAYSKYPVFQLLLQDVRLAKRESITWKSRLRKFFKYRLLGFLYFAMYAMITAFYVGFVWHFYVSQWFR